MKKLILLILIAMNFSCSRTNEMSAQNDPLLQIAKDRRSIRSYTDKPISRETMDSILTIAALAPSSYGQNPVEFVVVEDKETLKELAACKAIGALSVRNATAAVVVMADTTKGELWVEDTSVVAAYLLLAAEQYGVGACWNQIHLRDGKSKSSSREICELLGIPPNYEVECVVSLGYPAETKEPRSAEEMKKGRIHYFSDK